MLNPNQPKLPSPTQDRPQAPWKETASLAVPRREVQSLGREVDVSLQLHPSMSQTQTCAWRVTAHGKRRMQLQSSTACARIGNQAVPSRSRTSKLYAQQTIPDCPATGMMTSVLKEVSHEAQQRTGCAHARPSATDDQCSEHVVISVLKEANHKNPGSKRGV